MKAVVMFLLIHLFHKTSAVPPEYCLEPLNRSDCHVAVTPVFYYYKPGSRCEIGFWRGCPSLNIFPDQYICTHTCIARVYFGNVKEDLNYSPESLEKPVPMSIISESFNEKSCAVSLNTSNCTREHTVVYTFDLNDKVCTLGIWRGCKSSNMFMTLEDCKAECGGEELVEEVFEEWREKLNAIDDDEAEDIRDIVDTLAPNGTVPENITQNITDYDIQLLDPEVDEVVLTL